MTRPAYLDGGDRETLAIRALAVAIVGFVVAGAVAIAAFALVAVGAWVASWSWSELVRWSLVGLVVVGWFGLWVTARVLERKEERRW